jgi:hypothetical protein
MRSMYNSRPVDGSLFRDPHFDFRDCIPLPSAFTWSDPERVIHFESLPDVLPKLIIQDVTPVRPRRKSKEHVSRPLRLGPQRSQRESIMILSRAGENAAQPKQPPLRVAATRRQATEVDLIAAFSAIRSRNPLFSVPSPVSKERMRLGERWFFPIELSRCLYLFHLPSEAVSHLPSVC